MATPRVFADRFLLDATGSALDLATGDPVLLRVARSRRQPAAWSERCRALASIAHPWMAECVDHGAAGETYTFEAYRLVAAVTGRGVSPKRMAAAVAAFLAGCGLDNGVVCHRLGHGLVVVPTPGAPLEPSAGTKGRAEPRGVRLHEPRPLGAIVERLRDQPRPGLAWCDVGARRAEGERRLLRVVAREGRLLGWAPVCLDVLRRMPSIASAVAEHLAGRHLLVLHDARREASLERETTCADLARLASGADRPCLVVRLVDERSASAAAPDTSGRRRSCGDARAGVPSVSPCRSASTKADASVIAYPEGEPRGRWFVREATTPFRPGGEPGGQPGHGQTRPRLVRLHRTAAEVLAVARAALARGRHAAAERVLREAAAAAARRRAAADACALWLAVGRLLLGRGRAASAVTPIDEAAHWLAEASSLEAAVECALLRGHAALLTLDADRAEAAFRTAAATAAAAGDVTLSHAAAVRASEGLWWLGRYREAGALVGPVVPAIGNSPPSLAVDAHAVLARLAVVGGLADAAAGHVSAAAQLAEGAGTLVRRAATLARVRWLATIGDRSTLLAEAAPALSDARRDRAGLAVAEFRLLCAEGVLRARAPAEARPFIRGVRHLALGPTPPLVAVRARLVLAALAHRADAEKLRASLVARGFGGFSSPDAAGLSLPPPIVERSSPMLDAVIEMLKACQDEEPRAALGRVAELLRLRCSAAVVAIMTSGASPITIAVPSSCRPSVVAARRALDAGMPIDLHRVEAGQEAAVPMRHGGSLVGAVGCRWVNHPPGDPADVRRLLETAAAAAGPCARALDEQARPAELPREAGDLLGSSAAIQAVRRSIARAADAPFPTLVEGESGSGKELAARAIHRASVRRGRPFCAVNGAALPDDLLEAELFGHARGAFTGAVADRRGVFEEADGGVLFVDEVGELSMRAQAKLLRVVQEGEVRRLGETHVRHVDVRLVTATNRDLEAEVAAGRFRRDLFYRLAVIRIEMPALRNRSDDVPELAAALWIRAAARVGSRAVLSAATLAALSRYDWPGNVRELQNVLAALAVSAPRRGVVGPALLPAVIAREAAATVPVRLDEARRHFEARFVRAALARAGGHRGQAAADLGLTRQGLAKMLERLGIEPAEGDAS